MRGRRPRLVNLEVINVLTAVDGQRHRVVAGRFRLEIADDGAAPGRIGCHAPGAQRRGGDGAVRRLLDVSPPRGPRRRGGVGVLQFDQVADSGLVEARFRDQTAGRRAGSMAGRRTCGFVAESSATVIRDDCGAALSEVPSNRGDLGRQSRRIADVAVAARPHGKVDLVARGHAYGLRVGRGVQWAHPSRRGYRRQTVPGR